MDEVLAEFPEDVPAPEFATRVPCAEYFPVRDRALLARHPDRPNEGFTLHDRDVEREVWPTEDYHLARSHIQVMLPEDDLFAGLRPKPQTVLISGGEWRARRWRTGSNSTGSRPRSWNGPRRCARAVRRSTSATRHDRLDCMALLER